MPHIIVQDAKFKPRSFLDFVRYLRRYKKSSLIIVGCRAIWRNFRDGDEQSNYGTVLQAYGPKIILIALACATEHRNLLADDTSFFELCASYLQLPVPISNPEFNKAEASQFEENLKNTRMYSALKPEFFASESIFKGWEFTFISRGLGSQHRSFASGLEELYTDFNVLQILDSNTKNGASAIIEKTFGMSSLMFFRTAWGLFSITLPEKSSGYMEIENVTITDDVKERYSITLQNCIQLANEISFASDKLRPDWIDNGIYSEHDLYQSHYPDPLYSYPMIKDSDSSGQGFLIPSPRLYLRALRQSLFSRLFIDKAVGSALGGALEDHIFLALREIFGDAISRLEGAKKHADFLVQLPNCNIIFELKTNIGGFPARVMMKPKELSEIWDRLFHACQQCAALLEEIRKDSRKTCFCFVLIADAVVSEYRPFHVYADHVGLYKHLGINAIEYTSWGSLEWLLSETSIEEFERGLLKKWDAPDAMNIEGFDVERGTPSHSYEYFSDVESLMFPKKSLSVTD